MNRQRLEQHAAHKARRERMGMAVVAPVVVIPAPIEALPKMEPPREAKVIELRFCHNADAHVIDRALWLAGKKKNIPPALIVSVVSRRFGLTSKDVLGVRKTKMVCLARHVSFYLTLDLTSMSLPLTGQHIGRRDHTSVLHGRRRVSAMIASDPLFAATVEGIRREILEIARPSDLVDMDMAA